MPTLGRRCYLSGAGKPRVTFRRGGECWQPATGAQKRANLCPFAPTTSSSVPLFEQSDPEGQTMSNTHPENGPAHIG